MLRTKSKTTYLGIGIILGLLIIFHYLGLLRFVENGLRALNIPLLSRAHSFSVRVGNQYTFFQDKESFFAAYEQCSIELAKQNIDRAELALVREENNALRKQIQFKEKEKKSLVVAEVVGKEISGTNQVYIINRGSDDKVALNLPVIINDGILVGKIIKVEKNTSLVRLINDSQSKVAATIINQDHSLGILEGGYGISLRLNLIPRNEVVLAGNQIVTSGLDPTVPRGLLIGSVTEVENEPYKPFQQAIITPASDLSKLFLLSVILPNS
ncbi:MAG TPA: rod shape-determining protein MreC [Patescibacteria group bacterium]|nr:rod shape-determining protein MreC [Patescibacteria group bacterium]